MRDFLKYTFATLLGLLLFLGLSVGGLLSLLILVTSQDTEPLVKDKSVLVFDLSLNLTDGKRASTTRRALEEALSDDNEQSISLRAALDAINQATKDPRIVGLYVYGNTAATGNSTGYAALKEVREALQRFRAAGKKIIAYEVDWQERDYYLGSVANTVILNPIGSLEFNGLSSEGTFFAGALQRFGIGIQVTRVGKYKAAVEPLLLQKRSPANREQTQQILTDLWNEVLTSVAKDRKKSPQQLQAIADSQAVLIADEALKRGLVDKVAYTDEVIAELKQLTGNDEDDKTFRQISLKSYAEVAESAIAKERTSSNKIAVLYADGEIVNGQGSVATVGGDRFSRQLRQLRQDDDVKAVVLRINSPGGSVTASDVIQREVILTQKAKPVIVSMGSVAASGGYWIATYADRIFAEPNTVTGSIGVFGIQPNFQTLANNNGITWDVVKTGRYADSRTISRPKTPQELARLQRVVDKIYDQFITKVAESRKLPKAKVATIAEGRVWSGVKAKELGLVDQLGGLEDAIQEAAKRAKLGSDWQLTEYPTARNLGERLLRKLGEDNTWFRDNAQTDPLMIEWKRLQTELAPLKSLNDPLGIYARMPFNLSID